MPLWKTLKAYESRLILNRLLPIFTAITRPISKKSYSWPVLNETDIEETFIRGSGPGGQAVAKTSNCVQLKHMPTGIVVKGHETRSQAQNRKLAREKLIYKLDIYYNKENSFDAISKREAALKKQADKEKAKKRLDLKREFKAREGLD